MMVLPFILDFLKPPKLLIMRPDARKAGIELKAAFASKFFTALQHP